MRHALLSGIAEIVGEEILQHSPLSGGDISSAYRITTAHRDLFLKVHEGQMAQQMFEAEKAGLEAIAATGTIRTPHVDYCGMVGATAVLVMEFMVTKHPGAGDLERLGRQLADLHRATADRFGWETGNFIGSLPQANGWEEDWTGFYVSKRILPQLTQAMERNLLTAGEIPAEELLYERLRAIFPEIRPSLLHGDLWGGNYLISAGGTPCLIDPAVYYGHSEVDLAMSRLFGGFGSRFYAAYHEVIPSTPGSVERSEIYQLYYLLVHLNLFGGTYYPSVKHILTRYFVT